MQHLLLLFVLVFSGCTTIATYPPIENDAALSFSNSSNEPVPTIIAGVLSYAHDHYGGMDLIVFNLPEGVDKETYAIVSKKLGGALPMTSPNEIAYHIIELRLRGFSADADVIFPSTTGGYEMATMHLEASIVDPWKVTKDRIWLIPTNEPPFPNFSTEAVVEVEVDSP